MSDLGPGPDPEDVEPVGWLVDDEPAVDDEATMVGEAARGDQALSAEEEAVHLTAEPPMHDSDGYLED